MKVKFLDYLKQQCPGFRCNSLAVFKGISAEPHRDAHNVGLNAVVPISDFQGCDVVVKRGNQEVVLKVSEGPQLFDPHEEHYTTPCTEGTSLMLVGYSIRDSAKLKMEAIDLLEELGFEWDPHRSREDGDQLGGSRVPMMKVEVKPDVKEGLRKKGQGDLDYVNHDLDLAIQDMEERAARLRDLLEEEEIMVEQAHRLGRNFREELGDAREYVCCYLDGVHKQLVQLQQLREGIFLKAARSTEEELNAIDYEKLLDELEGDLDVIYTVPLEQVKRVLQRWTEAIKREVTSLFGSGTLVKVPYQKAKAMERDGTLKIVPAKCVFTLKPPPSKGSKYKRKCRMVICGNYITKDDAGEQMSLYASGTSSDVLRLALTVASSRTWVAAIADVTSAFLLAEWPAEMPRYALVPPKVIRDAVECDTDLWMVQRPLYGLRESPVIWSEFRNAKLRELKVLVRGRHLGLKQLQSESELWLLRDEQTQELYGILVVYVDDLMYLAERDVVIQLHNQIKALWPISDLEWVGFERAVRYLGVEIRQDPDSKAFSISQQAYIAELLRTHNMQDITHTQLPIPREWMDALETEKDVEAPSFSEEDLRQGQRLVGEALWLATKTRPDILFTVNAMASHVARNPLPVIRMGKRLLAYLAGTSDLELVMVPPEKGTRGTMTCFTDASFAPYGARSYGATVITYGRAPVLWKAGRQSFVTMSVMEAELYAAAQGYNLLESISSVLQEIEPDAFDKVLAIDNSSAVSMCNGGPGSQRTRHLKVRASFIREAVLSGRLTVKHTPGELQLADLATKLVSKERLWTLLRLWGFIGGKITRVIEAVKLKMMTFVLMLLSMITSADGREAERLEKEAIPVSGLDELAVVALFVCIAAIALWELSKSMAKFVWRQYKIAKKADKLSRVRKIASEAAEREISESANSGKATVSCRQPIGPLRLRARRTPVEEELHDRTSPRLPVEVEAEPATPTRTRCSQGCESSPIPPSPDSLFEYEAVTRLPSERVRVIRDTFALMTTESLKEALRCVGSPVSGLKKDLIERLLPFLGIEEPRAGSMRPSTKQLKYVLYIWRVRSLNGKCVLIWHDLASRQAVSEWISKWKTNDMR